MESQSQSSTDDRNAVKRADHFFSNTDMLLKIFDYLLWDEEDELDSDEAIAGKHTLAQAAVSCRTFLEPALDRLWRSLDTLFPLLKLLPAFVQSEGTYVLRGPLTANDWARFDFYANRVKNFSYTRDPEDLDIAMHVYFRIAQLRLTPILPSLQYIYCPSISQNDFLISGVCLFLSPSLVAVEIGEITSVEDKLCGTFLHTLLNDGAPLEKIILRGQALGKETLALIPRFERLQVLELTGMGESLSVEWLETVGALPALVDVDLDFTDSSILPLEKDVGFKLLKSLSITAPLPFIQAFVANISTYQLDTFVSLSPPEAGFDRKLLVENIVSRWSSSLRRFGLRLTPEDTEEELPLSTLKPLLPLRNLRSLRLRGYLMDIGDELINEWANAWPHLTDLLLPFVLPTRVRPTMNSLRTLAEHCPNLTELRIPLDTSDVQPFVSASKTKLTPPPAQSKHGLQSLTIATAGDDWDSRDVFHIGRHLDHLFPNLKFVHPYEGHQDERWEQVHELVQLAQTVRAETVAARIALGS